VLHFSEDATIGTFEPRVPPPSSALASPVVWAIDADRAPDYWFPRQCPRAMAWVGPATTDVDRERIIGAGSGRRVHVIEYAWLEAMREVELYAYRLPSGTFRPISADDPHALVSEVAVQPIGAPERVGDLFALHAEADIQLRVLDNLWTFWWEAIHSTVQFSGIRLRNAAPDPTGRLASS
jgi:hypothetical protein